MIKEFISAVAIILTFMTLLPYLLSVLRNQVKPHVFSWVIWAILILTAVDLLGFGPTYIKSYYSPYDEL